MRERIVKNAQNNPQTALKILEKIQEEIYRMY